MIRFRIVPAESFRRVVRRVVRTLLVVSVRGGLGNQLFQYAFGRGAERHLDRRLVLDLTLMPTGAPPNVRRFGLDDFPRLRVPWSLGAHGLRSRPEVSRPRVRRIGQLGRSLLGRFVVREPSLDQKLALSEIPKPLALLSGYWQSPHYFEHIASDIRRELTLPVLRGSPTHQVLSNLRGRPGLLIHVRRGDYVARQGESTTHGVKNREYYVQAVEEMLRKVGEVVALVVSDDPNWVETELRLPIEVVNVEHRGSLTPLDALALMSNSQHHIIANSSFSWWGAWLAEHDGQHVIYPRKWFATRPIVPEFRFPRSWQPLDC